MSAALRRVIAGAGCGLALAAVDCTLAPDDRPRACTEDDALTLFEQRIAPLLADGKVSSCNQCHLSGVELSLYVRGDPCTTMACMVESGIVDAQDPEASLVLDWILRAEPDSSLITEEVIRSEHDAMLEWIDYNARCGADVCAPVENPCGDAPESCEVPVSSVASGRKPFADPGDCRDRTLEAGFAALVYAWRGRCYPCHFTSRSDASYEDAPQWIHDGPCDLGAVESMHDVIALGLLDVEDPAQSLLLLKPLAVASGGVEHGGGDKMHDLDDPAYRDFLQWIERWAQCRAAR